MFWLVFPPCFTYYVDWNLYLIFQKPFIFKSPFYSGMHYCFESIEIWLMRGDGISSLCVQLFQVLIKVPRRVAALDPPFTWFFPCTENRISEESLAHSEGTLLSFNNSRGSIIPWVSCHRAVPLSEWKHENSIDMQSPQFSEKISNQRIPQMYIKKRQLSSMMTIITSKLSLS